MKRFYANLLGAWTDITDDGTVGESYTSPSVFFDENLAYDGNSKVARCFEYDYINIQYKGKNYRIHPTMIQIVTE